MEFAQIHKTILDSMSEAVYVVDRDMTILYCNPAAETLTGHTAGETIGQACSAIFCEKSEYCAGKCPPQRAISHHEAVLHREAETKAKDGSIRQTQLSVSPFFSQGECVGAVIVLKDITALKQAEERIQRQKRFLENVIESLDHPFRVIDADTYEILLANSAEHPSPLPPGATCHLLSYKRETPCQDSAEYPCSVRLVKMSGEPAVVEHRNVSRSGEVRHLEIHAFPVRNEEGRIHQVIQYSIDVTARKLAEQERERLIAELTSALAQVKQLSGLLPICSSCKKIRDDKGYWNQIEEYIHTHSEAHFSHSICPDCVAKLYPTLKRQPR